MAVVGSLNATLGLNSTGFTSGLKKAQGDTQSFVGGITGMNGKLGSALDGFTKFNGKMGAMANMVKGGVLVMALQKMASEVEKTAKFTIQAADTWEYFGKMSSSAAGKAKAFGSVISDVSGVFADLLSLDSTRLANRLFPDLKKQTADLESIRKTMKSLREEVETFGMTRGQLVGRELEGLNARKSDITDALDLVRDLERMKTIKTDQEAADKTIEKLKEEIATLGMSAEAVENYRVQQSKASAASKERVKLLTDEIGALNAKGKAEEAAAKAAEQAARAIEESQRRVGSIRDKFMDYMQEIKAANLMPQGGGYNTQEARNRLNQINSGTGGKSLLEKLTQEELNELKKHGNLLQNIRRAIEDGSDDVELGTAWF